MNWIEPLVLFAIGVPAGWLLARFGYRRGYEAGKKAPVFRQVYNVHNDESTPAPTVSSADFRRAAHTDVLRISGPGNLREKD